MKNFFLSRLFRKQKQIGLCLSGGGIRGYAHLGVLKAFEEEGLTFDAFSGTSIGAIIGSAYALGYSSDEIYAYAKTIQFKNFLRLQPRLRDNAEQSRFSGKNFLDARSLRLTPSAKVLIDLCVNFYGQKEFSDTKYPFYCVACDIQHGREVVFDSGSLPFAVACSSALPGVFTPVVTNDSILVDGYVMNNLPADVLKNKGMDYVVCVDLKPIGDHTPCRNAGYFETIFSVFDLMARQTSQKGLAAADVVLTPSLSSFEKLSFNETVITGLYQAGYTCAKQNMASLKELFARL